MCSSLVVGTRSIACANIWEDCAIVTAVGIITHTTNARVEVEFGLLAHVRRGESGLGGIDVCGLPGIVSASWNVSLASESSSEITKADSLGGEDGRTGALFFFVSVTEAFPLKAQHSPSQSSQMNQTQTSPSPPSQNSTLLPW